MKIQHTLIAIVVTVLAMFSIRSSAADNTAEQQIRSLISTTYDQPQHKVETAPIVVVNSYAIADWVQGDNGGRALLRLHRGQWEIVACGGDGFKDAKVLQDAGIPVDTAKQLVTRLNRAEAKLSAQRVKQFDLFGNAQTMMPPGHHGHAR